MDSRDDVVIAGLDSPVGRIGVAVTRVGLAAVSWCDADELAADVAGRGGPPRVPDDGRAEPLLAELRAYFAGELREFTTPVDWRFSSRGQRAVLETLYRTVPYGASITYGGLAERAGTGVPARGIGAIMGSNPIPIVVACHRVLASDGLGGYSGGTGEDGLATKRWLLILEGVLEPTLDWAL